MEKEQYSIGAHYMKLEKNECFDDILVLVVDLPVSEHKKPEVVAAKKKELENLEYHGTFEELDKEEDMKTIGSR